MEYQSEPLIGLPTRPAADQRAGADERQGERAGRGADHLAAADRPGQPDPRPLELRPRPLGRLHLRRRPQVGQPVADLGQLRRLLVAGRPLGPAAGRPRQPDRLAPPRGGARSRWSSMRSTRRTSSSTSSSSRATSTARTGRLDAPAEPLELVQVAPGKYEGTIEDAEARGNYFVTLGYRGADGEQGIITTGLSVPYSDEYRDLRSNPVVLRGARRRDRRRGLPLGHRPRRPPRPDPDGRRRRRLPPRRPDPAAPELPADLAPAALCSPACVFLVDVAVRRDRPRRGPHPPERRRRLAEAPRPGGRPPRGVHGEAPEPQGRGRRADRPLPRRHPLRGPADRPGRPADRARAASPLLEGRRRRTGPGPARKAAPASAPTSRQRSRPSRSRTPTACSRPRRRSGRSARRTRASRGQVRVGTAHRSESTAARTEDRTMSDCRPRVDGSPRRGVPRRPTAGSRARSARSSSATTRSCTAC